MSNQPSQTLQQYQTFRSEGTLVGQRHSLNPPEYHDLRPLNLHMLILADTIS